eukprot:6260807-Amphidinium_carterae.1
MRMTHHPPAPQPSSSASFTMMIRSPTRTSRKSPGLCLFHASLKSPPSHVAEKEVPARAGLNCPTGSNRLHRECGRASLASQRAAIKIAPTTPALARKRASNV